MAKTKESQLRASKAYRERNKLPEYYRSCYRGAVNMLSPKEGTNAQKAIAWAKEDGRYFDDLRELKRLIDQALKNEQ